MDKGEVVIPAKDEEELLLEKLVFGDKSGFESNLKKVDNLFDYSDDEEEEQQDGEDMEDIDGDDELGGVQDDDLFFIDEGNDAMEVDEQEEQEGESEEEEESEEDNAWYDSDDERLNISLTSSDRLRKLRKTQQDSSISGKAYITRLRSQFEKIYPRPQWAEEDDEEEVEEDNSDEEIEPIEKSTNALLNLLSTTQSFIITKQLKLISPNRIAISRLKDANYQKYAKSAIQSISFHPTHPFLLTGGYDKTIRVYHIDGKSNNFITSFFLKNCPIQTVQFAASPAGEDSNLIFAGGRRRYMNKIDLNNGQVEKISRLYGHEQHQKSFEYFKISSKGTYIGLTGNSGWCNILNGKTGQYLTGFKIEGTIVDFEFSNDESFIVIVNSAGEVWEYELSTNNKKSNKTNIHHKILRKWVDDGGIGITKIKLGGPKNRWVAVGTNNGIVNIYDRNSFTSDSATSFRPKPIKTVENLITSISSLVFNADGQILCIASRGKRDALRLVHLPSGSVYSNWPTSGTPLGRVTSVVFSPNNEMLAIGNESEHNQYRDPRTHQITPALYRVRAPFFWRNTISLIVLSAIPLGVYLYTFKKLSGDDLADIPIPPISDEELKVLRKEYEEKKAAK
ncbi:U3 small nucleolar RNA-associated protein [Spathaspora sp. JA1]|nr:U3 small nucleolar RNA-associated protein [Spathaspora sp. JA1]